MILTSNKIVLTKNISSSKKNISKTMKQMPLRMETLKNDDKLYFPFYMEKDPIPIPYI